jgi:hypothetical protein
MIWWSLRDRGVSVWWDREILAGERFDQAIDDALENAKCVLVLWSRRSVRSDWVQDEATRGRSRGVLIPVRIDDAAAPLGFSRLQTADLAGWQGEADHPELQRLVKSIERLLGPARERTDSQPQAQLRQWQALDEELEPRYFEPPPSAQGQAFWAALWTTALLLCGFTAADVVSAYESGKPGPPMLRQAYEWVTEDACDWVMAQLTWKRAGTGRAGTVVIAPSRTLEEPTIEASAGRRDRQPARPKSRPGAPRPAGVG